MDANRANEIVSADVFVNVNYHGIPVYIEDVYQNTAKVFPLDAIHNVQEVDVEGLNESGPISI
ncbi:small, acid-soluble spore protein, H family [Ornithinibacillus xuwenensis]|uniref:Small, acid-soluble spore protein, H family n=1 Tax=Ornithinibacillus xuwenensis TaxID=3144668 RepID=A0ABU9XFH9_9BACI